MRKLSPLPVRFLINTETHPDHTSGHWLFSPPAVVINHEGAGKEMTESYNPNRVSELEKQSPEMCAAIQGFKLVTPQIEYGDKLTLHGGAPHSSCSNFFSMPGTSKLCLHHATYFSKPAT